MFPLVFILFIAMPILEIAVLIQVGSSIGLLSTLAIIIATAILGTFMLRQQGLATLQRAQSRLATGEMPAQQLMEGMILLVGGVLLLTPGFVTDAIGFFCLIPFTRQWLAARIAQRSIISMMPGGAGGSRGPGSPNTGGFESSTAGRSNNRSSASANRDSEIIEGSFRHEDEK